MATKRLWLLLFVTVFLLVGVAGCTLEDYNAAESTTPDSATPEAETITYEQATVTRNIDGDTIEVELSDGSVEKVRFIGIDTPESTNEHEPYGDKAALYTELTIPPGTIVYLEKDVSETDRYDRLLRYVWLEKPASDSEQEARDKMLNAILVLEGYANASTYPPDVKYSNFFAQCENEARSSDLGLWGLAETIAPTIVPTVVPTIVPSPTNMPTATPEPAPEPTPTVAPAEPDPTAAPAPAEYKYCASKESNKFHYLNCRYVQNILPENMVYYYTREEAMADGKEPCKVCKP